MELKLDRTKEYAVALEGGGARGAYEIGVWQALEEAGIRCSAVAGTSVGALNGALMAMRDMKTALSVWSDIRLSDVMALNERESTEFAELLQGRMKLGEVRQLLPQLGGVIRNRGIDVAPLRAWVRETVDPERIRSSPVSLFVTTFCISDKKALELKLNDMDGEEILNMLLASAYHPAFRSEPLGGKFYADGGFVDALPIHVLTENGYKNIIAVHMNGFGRQRHFRLPADVSVTHVKPVADLGGALNFSAEQARMDMRIGYFDCRRVLYGLYGQKYYVIRSMDDRSALELLLERDRPERLRDYLEKQLPAQARRLGVRGGDYYELMLARVEELAERKGLPKLREWDDGELIAAAFPAGQASAAVR